MQKRISCGVSVVCLAALFLGACSDSSKNAKPAPDAGEADAGEPAPEYKISTRPDLQWKRFAALEADLAAALELPPEELCTELGRESCIREAHLVPLGGNSPFTTGMLEPSAEPLATTPFAVDRSVLSACTERVRRDRELGMSKARVFSQFALDADAPAPDDAAVVQLVTTLYRRLLARDPGEDEIPLVAALAQDGDSAQPIGAAEFAALACYAIGTTTEFLFF
jgi:hypothetical protein